MLSPITIHPEVSLERLKERKILVVLQLPRPLLPRFCDLLSLSSAAPSLPQRTIKRSPSSVPLLFLPRFVVHPTSSASPRKSFNTHETDWAAVGRVLIDIGLCKCFAADERPRGRNPPPNRSADRDERMEMRLESCLTRKYVTVPLAMCRLSHVNHLLKSISLPSGLYSLSVSPSNIRKRLRRNCKRTIISR